MTLEHSEILVFRHYHASLALLNQVERSIETASTTVEGHRAAVERYQKMLQLHQLVEERYQQLWLEPCSERSEAPFSLPFHAPAEPPGPSSMTLKNCLELPCDASYLSTARHMAQSLLEWTPSDREEMDNVLLIVGELCGNVIRHAGLTSDDCFRLEIEIDRGTISITVTDPGKGFVRNRNVLPDWDSECGRGLWLIESLSDRVEYNSKTDGRGQSVLAQVSLGKR